MRKKSLVDLNTISYFIRGILPSLRDKPLIRSLKAGPILYVGDIHGFYQNLMDAFNLARSKQVQTLVFLGDYADRGKEQLKCLCKVMDAFARSEGYSQKQILSHFIDEECFPFKVIALRGNHEDPEINIRYGFRDELKNKHSFPIFPEQTLDELYNHLPILTSSKWKTIGMHGGIPKPENGTTLIRNLITKKTPLEASFAVRQQVYQALWNDPFDNNEQTPQFRENYRGPNIYEFNRAALEQFFKETKYKRLVRAHESVNEGYNVRWDNQLVHIFSASPYFDRVKTAAYFLEFDDGSGEIINKKGKCLRKVDPTK